nr:copia protein [Tanacetum cinerariifolium]
MAQGKNGLHQSPSKGRPPLWGIYTLSLPWRGETPKVLSRAWGKFFEIQHAQPEDTHELLRKLLEDLQVINEELTEYINSPSWNCLAFYNDVDDDEYSIQVKSDEVIKSSVEDIVPILSESEGILDNMCDVPLSDKNHFDAESGLIKSLLTRDTSIVYSPKIDSLLEEFASELAHIDPIPPGIDETDFDPKDDIRFIEQLLYDDTLSEEDSFEYIDYVEASPLDSELVSLEETFSDHAEETSSGSTTTHADNSLLEYDSCSFEIEPDQGELSSIAMESILGEPRVYVPNVLPTHPTLYQDSDFYSSDDSLGSGLEISVTFGGGAKGGKITGKGTIRIGKLDFKDVYFVKELQFNLFSVSQMCDKKNSVLFTDTECFVLSPNFKLADESQVLLKVPRKNNMYSFDMKNMVPQKDLTFLLAKTTNDESMLWHRRLATNDETSRIFKSFITEIENLVEKKVKIIRCDNRTKFKNRVMNEFCEEKDQLGKFDRISDEGIFVGYSTTSKAFRIYNIKTRKVEENLYITFLENKPMIIGGRLEWLFDLDALSKSINYAPVFAGTNSNNFVGKGASFNASQSSMETGSSQDYILMPLWKDNSLFDSSSQALDSHNKDKHGPSQASDSDNQKRPNAESSTKTVNTAGPVNTTTPTYVDSPNDPLMPDLEDDEIFDDAYDDRDEGAKADYDNLETVIPVSPIPCTIIHKDHPKEHIIGEVEAMQEELLQFKLLNVWTLVDLPPRKRVIGTKWVYRNKRDQREIVVKSKARMVTQGHRQEEGIYYEIRLFLAYTSFMDFTVYQMDVESAFLYGTIEEEVYVSQHLGFVDPEFPNRVYKVEKALYGKLLELGMRLYPPTYWIIDSEEG